MKTLQSLRLSKALLINSFSDKMTFENKKKVYMKIGKITISIKKLELEEIRKIKNPLSDH